MNLDKVKALIGRVAPTVGVALGGPLGGIAGKVIQDALGVEGEDAVVAALQADPNAVLELKKAEIAFQQFLRDAEIREDQLVAEDRKDARLMARAFGNAGPQLGIVIGLTALVGWVIYELFLESPPKGSENVLFIILGQLTTAWTAAISFFVGTTKSSADKTAALARSN